mmetsp:Transcript_12423/g.38253  ORF Transcript_12423/g.38253 Transcript_12423/m.38253 type:complete len:264 (-) Transcript_12423:103-894(-)
MLFAKHRAYVSTTLESGAASSAPSASSRRARMPATSSNEQSASGRGGGGGDRDAPASGDRDGKPNIMSPEEEIGRQVYVGNLNFGTDKPFVEKTMSEFGEVRDVYLPQDNDGRPRGFAFVTFAEKSEADACALGMNGRELDGRTVRCNIARPRPPRDSWKDRDDRRGGGRDDRGGRDGYYERDRRPPPEGRIFVSGLPEDIKERELDDLYYRYGRIDYIEIKRGGRRLEAVICYFDRRDASYAQRETDGMRFERDTLRVDLER